MQWLCDTPAFSDAMQMPTLIAFFFSLQMNTIIASVILSLLVLINSPKHTDCSVIRMDNGPYDCFEGCELRYDDCNYSCTLSRTLTQSACEELCKSPLTGCLSDCPIDW